MTDLIHQILDIAKGIAHIFSISILGPLTLIIKSIGTLFVKILELIVLVIKWGIAKL